MGRLNHDTGYHPMPDKERHRRKKTKEEANKEEIRNIGDRRKTNKDQLGF
jgi:hypothetical protein